MTDPRRLVARLNPASVRYDVGRGGTPELTAQDIAAALAFVPAGLGREVFCALWWPDGARLSRRDLLGKVTRIVGEEWRRQAQALAEARIDLGIAHAIAGWGHHTSPEQRRNIDAAARALEARKRRCWPDKLPDRLPAILESVLEEIAMPNLCAQCGGRAQAIVGALLVKCSVCDGRGTLPVSDRKRARAIGVDESTYRETWRDCYGWIYRTVADAENEAAKGMASALRG